MTQRPFVKEDLVVLHTCEEAEQFPGKVWICESDQFTATDDEPVIQLKGLNGQIPIKYLALVNGDMQKENERLRTMIQYARNEMSNGLYMERYWARYDLSETLELALQGKWDAVSSILDAPQNKEYKAQNYPFPHEIPWIRYSENINRIISHEDHLVTNGVQKVIAQHVRIPGSTAYGWMANCVLLPGITHYAVLNQPHNERG